MTASKLDEPLSGTFGWRHTSRSWVPGTATGGNGFRIRNPLPRHLVTGTHCLGYSHGGFVAAWGSATVRAFLGGFLRPEDAFNLVVAGAQSDILR
jgi:hypothetical protein